MADKTITLAERTEITNAHWEATKAWIASGYTDEAAKCIMETLRQVMLGWLE